MRIFVKDIGYLSVKEEDEKHINRVLLSKDDKRMFVTVEVYDIYEEKYRKTSINIDYIIRVFHS